MRGKGLNGAKLGTYRLGEPQDSCFCCGIVCLSQISNLSDFEIAKARSGHQTLTTPTQAYLPCIPM